jgi:hypothetical protein
MSNKTNIITGDTVMLTAEYKRQSVIAKKASLTTAFNTTEYPDCSINSNIKFEAIEDGEVGNGITIEFADDGWIAESTDTAFVPEDQVEVHGKSIKVRLERSNNKYNKAKLQTDFETTNADLIIEAVENGLVGNDISIAFINPAMVSNTIDVAVIDNKDIVVALTTDGNGTVASTASAVIAAINSDTVASKIVNARLFVSTGNTGAGIVGTFARTFLSGGKSIGDTASLTTALAGDNNDIIWSSKIEGNPGNSLSVTYIASTINQSLAATLSGTDLVITLATNGTGVVTTTADALITYLNIYFQSYPAWTDITGLYNWKLAGLLGTGTLTALSKTYLAGGEDVPRILTTAGDIQTLVEASALAAKLVKITYPDGSSGSGVVPEMEPTNLTGGSVDPEYYDVTVEAVNIYDKWENLLATNTEPVKKIETGKYEVPMTIPKDYDVIIQEWVANYDSYPLRHRKVLDVLWREAASTGGTT